MKDRPVAEDEVMTLARPRAEGDGSSVKRLEVLGSIGKAIGTPRDLEKLYRVIYEEAGRVLDTTGFILGLYDEVGQTVTVVYQVDSGVELPGGTFPLGAGFTSQVIRTREPRLIRRWSEEGPRVQIQYATQQQGLPESGITVPLLRGDRVIGTISVQSYQPEAYGLADLLTLQVIAGQVSSAIQNLRNSASLEGSNQHRLSDLEAILSGMTEALLIVDEDGRITRLNGAARKLLCPEGGDVTIVLGQPLDREQWGLWPLGPRGVAEALAPLIQALRRGDELSDFEVEIRGEGRRIFSFSCAPLRDGPGKLTGGVIIFRDVTGRREVERIKDEVLSIASHELKAPITVIKAQAQILHHQANSGKLGPDSLAQGLTSIVRQSDRLVGMLGLLMDLSRIEAGRLELELLPTDLASLARTVVEGVQATTDRHRLTVHCPEGVEGQWDPRRLEQLLQNLLGNAVKYSPNGGTIELAIDARDTAVTVSVSDEGVGIPAEEASLLFERFYRAEGTRRLEGSGLGLYICEGIVSAHGGRIWVESAGPGHGSTFYFTLPRQSPSL